MPPLSDDDIQRRLSGRPGWTRDGDTLKRQFEFENFVASVDFVNRITPPAEEMNHHPDIAISWNRVTIRTWSHDANAITERDTALARALDAL